MLTQLKKNSAALKESFAVALQQKAPKYAFKQPTTGTERLRLLVY